MSDTLVRNCLICGKEFLIEKGRINAVYCSHECRAEGRKNHTRASAKNRGREKTPRPCRKCGKIFTPVHQAMIYCSEECRPKKGSTVDYQPMKCIVCGEVFTPSNKRQQWCGAKCYRKIQREKSKAKNQDEMTMVCSDGDKIDDLERVAREQGITYGMLKAKEYADRHARVELPEWAKGEKKCRSNSQKLSWDC